jgi:hypothetical protein
MPLVTAALALTGPRELPRGPLSAVAGGVVSRKVDAFGVFGVLTEKAANEALAKNQVGLASHIRALGWEAQDFSDVVVTALGKAGAESGNRDQIFGIRVRSLCRGTTGLGFRVKGLLGFGVWS